MTFEPLEAIENKFYFGIGGIGDLLLLMATFYDDIDDETDVVFVCNNVNVIRKFSILLFPKVHRWWFYPRKAFYANSAMWETISKYALCQGTGVTPKDFDYIGDWIECGKSNVFDYYGVKKHPNWAEPIRMVNQPLVCVQPFGGADDPTKIKAMSKEQIVELISHMDDYELYFTGSESDKDRFKSVYEYNDIEWVTDFFQTFRLIRASTLFYSSDTWGKTLAGLAGVPTTIFPNQYSRPVEEIFGHPVDPSDYVFLKDWGFSYATS